jgi:hypothetical protein
VSRVAQDRVARLSAEVKALREEVAFLRQHPKLAAGLRGEDLILELLGGTRSAAGKGFDVLVGGRRLEVKWSSLLSMKGKGTKRWVWTKIHGERGRKRFHSVILVAPKDPRYAHLYRDAAGPYVFFDVPYAHAARLTNGIRHGSASAIHLTTNPSVLRSLRAVALFQRYQATYVELKRRYPGTFQPRA